MALPEVVAFRQSHAMDTSVDMSTVDISMIVKGDY
jgi:hypothetical protein